MMPDLINMDEQLEGVGNPFYKKDKKESFFPEGTVLKLFTGNLTEPGDRAVAESLLTKSMQVQGYLKNPGDVAIIDRNGTFDRNGDYRIYIYYAMLPETPKKDKKDADNS